MIDAVTILVNSKEERTCVSEVRFLSFFLKKATTVASNETINANTALIESSLLCCGSVDSHPSIMHCMRLELGSNTYVYRLTVHVMQSWDLFQVERGPMGPSLSIALLQAGFCTVVAFPGRPVHSNSAHSFLDRIDHCGVVLL